MYLTYYNLRREPFSLTPNPQFMQWAEPHQAALLATLRGIVGRKGFVVLTGPVGTGKTTVLHFALHMLRRKSSAIPVSAALLVNPTLTREEFLEAVLEDFGIPCAVSSKTRRLMLLQQHLLEQQSRGGTCALFVDEAHLLTAELLEEIRLLGNFDTHANKMLQVVMVGQPELKTILADPRMAALRQRIFIRCELRPLSLAEVRAYIAQRLHAAGLSGPSPFPAAVIEDIHRYSGGVPRIINMLCDACLIAGHASNRPQIGTDMVLDSAFALNLDGLSPSDVVLSQSTTNTNAPLKEQRTGAGSNR